MRVKYEDLKGYIRREGRYVRKKTRKKGKKGWNKPPNTRTHPIWCTYKQRHEDPAVIAGVQGERDAQTGLSLIF